MNKFIAECCHEYDDRINDDMFLRTYSKPLHEYIVDTCKNLEVIPGLTLEDWYLETDQTKIQDTVNKRNAKDPKIKNNRMLEHLISSNTTLCDMLYLKFRVCAKGREEVVWRRVKILKRLPNGMYLRNGNKVRILNQIVDNSTFVKGNVLNFKTKLYAIKLFTVRQKLVFTDDTVSNSFVFRLDLLSKVTNPLIYYLANFGLSLTIRHFSLEDCVSVVDSPIDEGHYMYLKINNGIYLEVHEKAYTENRFIASFIATLYEVLKEDPEMTFKDVYNRKYWLERLAEIFSKKRYVNKGLRVLVSFNKIMDVGVKKQLVLRKCHKEDTFTILRWMMTNYEDLLKKDSHDLKYKRVRAEETLAYFFDKHITKNVYSLLNTDNPPFEKYLRLLNSINENTLLKGAHGGGRTSSTSMFRYERYNDFDAIEIARYTLKGPTGLNGGKNGVSLKYRDIYPSHIGRIDMNVCSSSDPGLTGYLTCNVKLDKSGYFDITDPEPDRYDDEIAKLLPKFVDPNYEHEREQYIKTQLSKDEDGYIHLHRIPKPHEIQKMMIEDPESLGLYRTKEGLRISPYIPRDQKGYIILTRKKPQRKVSEEVRDKDGYVILKRVQTKLDRIKVTRKGI